MPNASFENPTIVMSGSAKLCTLVVTCVTQDGVTVTGQTVTIRKTDASGSVFDTQTYNGQPLSFTLPYGFDYYVSVSDTLAHHFNPTTVRGVMNAGTVNVILTYSDYSNINTFTDIQAALNNDLDLTAIVGEQVTLTRQNTDHTFDIVDYDTDEHVVTLLMHEVLPDYMVFEPAQALTYFPDGLEAGAYTFKHSNVNYYFTLTEDVPAGGQLRATVSAFTTYASQYDDVEIETGVVNTTAITGATLLGTTASGNLNNMDRVNNGSNNSGESGLWAWLNSDAAPNTTLSPRINKFSRPYATGTSGGWLYGIDPEALAVIADTVWDIQANNTYEAPASMGGIALKNSWYTITSKFGLARLGDVGLGGNVPWALYSQATATDRIKYTGTTKRGWWLAAPSVNNAYIEYYVNTSGASSSSYYYATNSYGVVPACKIKKSL